MRGIKSDICSICKKNKKGKSGSYCKDCHNEYQKAYYKKHPLGINESVKRRKKLVRDMVKGGKSIKCMDCGKEYPWYVMDYDHVRGIKKFNLSVAASKYRKLDSIIEEMAKCDIVCSNCHRERTFNRKKALVAK